MEEITKIVHIKVDLRTQEVLQNLEIYKIVMEIFD